MAVEINGILLIDKPRGMTSHDVVNRVRRLCGMRRVGHCGTLDPMAEGLLIMCLGRATRVAQFLTGLDKTYVGEIVLGQVSSTYDAEGKITPQTRPVPEDAQPIEGAMARQLGEIAQQPPPYSAVKVRGKKLYEYARSGEEVPTKVRHVHVFDFELIRYTPPRVQFAAKVSSGTYLRSIAHDLGIEVGCGGYLSQLRRTAVGSFSVEDAVPLETLLAEPQLLDAHLLNVGQGLAHLPKVIVPPKLEAAILNGHDFTTAEVLEFDGILIPGQPVVVMNPIGRVLSVARADSESSEAESRNATLGATPMRFRPMRVLGTVNG